MYAQFFGLKKEPFSIAPDPRYLFMSERHREALAHLLYGVKGGGGFVLLTGEIGAGKTTVCRCFLEQIPRRCNVAYIFNPKLTVSELLKSVCDEFRIPYQHQGPGVETVKDYLDPLNEFLLKTHAVGQNNVLIIDEAQNLSADVLEQLRLLTNLETSERKLLQIILIGQPELRTMLAQPELEQLAQRVIARFHLAALSEDETAQYITHRLMVAGSVKGRLFDNSAMQRVHELSRGVPRRINLLCDRALLGAYTEGKSRVDRRIVDKAAAEVFDQAVPEAPVAAPRRHLSPAVRWSMVGVAGAGLLGLAGWAALGGGRAFMNATAPTASDAASGPVRVAASPPLAPSSVASSARAIAQRIRFESAPRDQRDAWRDLARLWNVNLPEGDPCVVAQRSQLQCFRSSSGLDLIRQLGRPGILTLRDERGQPVYAVLIGLGRQSASLRLGSNVQTVSLLALAKVWRGDFATYWRVPPGYHYKVVNGHTGPAVDWLTAQLSKLQGEPEPIGPQTFNAKWQSQVYAFQMSQGIKPDGVAGAMTLMQLNRVANVDEPRLQQER